MLSKFYKFMGAKSAKDKFIITVKLMGLAVASCMFAFVLYAFIWVCYYIGIPM